MSSDIRLIAPVNDGFADAGAAIFSWSASAHADMYRLQVARDSAFLDVVFDARIPRTDTFTLFNALRPRQEAYHWRLQLVRAGSEGWSEAATFRAVSDVQTAAQTAAQTKRAAGMAAHPRPAGNGAPTSRPVAARHVVQEGAPAPYLTETTPAGMATTVLVITIVMLVVIGWFVSMGRIWG
ncbi:MAG: hypothetical protein SH809_00520 [Rhodothermales bacterium]|nr:hypothetical protein [Rhodothermales bacterium]